jgi:hypothetical protein
MGLTTFGEVRISCNLPSLDQKPNAEYYERLNTILVICSNVNYVVRNKDTDTNEVFDAISVYD